MSDTPRVVDPLGNAWSWDHDLRGREVSQTDPDSGTTTSTYDDADRLLTVTDAGGTSLRYTYDDLDRKTAEWRGAVGTGTQLASWTYDTLAKEQLTESKRWNGTSVFTTTVTGYDDAYKPLGETVTVPSAAGAGLAGAWTTSNTYNVDGSTASVSYPAVGTLAAETVSNTYDANGFQQTATGRDTYLSAATYQPWGGDVHQRTFGGGSKRVRVTTDQWATSHHVKSISTATESQATAGSFDEQYTQAYTWSPGDTVSSIDTTRGGVRSPSRSVSPTMRSSS